MTRGGDRGGRRPKVLQDQVTRSFVLEARHDDLVKRAAGAWGVSESAAIRRIIHDWHLVLPGIITKGK